MHKEISRKVKTILILFSKMNVGHTLISSGLNQYELKINIHTQVVVDWNKGIQFLI